VGYDAGLAWEACMPVYNRIAEFHEDMAAWRRDIHAHPETAFEEHRTSRLVAERLASFGVEVHRGLAGTGIVGVLRNGPGPSIGLRADMDALHIHEANHFDHASTNPGRMHACGHDGHTAMLLGAARYLAETKRFRGTVHFIFQPAEENEAGGRRMVEEGLFKQFPVDAVYGMHNWPGLAAGTFAVKAGPVMAASDHFEIIVTGLGAHAAMPHRGVDPVVTAAQMVTALQTISSRTVDPLDGVVVSVTQFHAGDTWNVIPETVMLRGTVRTFRAEVQDRAEATLKRIAQGVADAFGARIGLSYHRLYPATANTVAEAEIAKRAAQAVVGEHQVDLDPPPSMGAEDFSFMLKERPGCYIWLGNGPGEGGCTLHNPRYDFNDAILPVGASYWVKLVETVQGA
jgi:amidohydrolase